MGKEHLGLVQVFWGDGKGKTTSALGTGLRAVGNGFNVFLVQFMKNGAESLEQQIPGEIKALNKFSSFHYKRFGIEGWIVGKPTKNQIKSCKEALAYVKSVLKKPETDIVIADEILYAVQLGLLTQKEVIELIKDKPKNVEIILTGSHGPLDKIFGHADLISHIKKLKHPYDLGILARKGLEF